MRDERTENGWLIHFENCQLLAHSKVDMGRHVGYMMTLKDGDKVEEKYCIFDRWFDSPVVGCASEKYSSEMNNAVCQLNDIAIFSFRAATI